jgi:hypothetical protein
MIVNLKVKDFQPGEIEFYEMLSPTKDHVEIAYRADRTGDFLNLFIMINFYQTYVSDPRNRFPIALAQIHYEMESNGIVTVEDIHNLAGFATGQLNGYIYDVCNRTGKDAPICINPPLNEVRKDIEPIVEMFMAKSN